MKKGKFLQGLSQNAFVAERLDGEPQDTPLKMVWTRGGAGGRCCLPR